jgi:hypothetical protein
MVYPDVTDSYNEWRCEHYTDTFGGFVDANGVTVTAKSRCEYKLKLSFMDDLDN